MLLARIECTSLGYEDHGVFLWWLHVDYTGSGQGIGGYVLDEPIKDDTGKFFKRCGTAYGMDVIIRVLKVVGVVEWEDLKGCRVYVLKEKYDDWGFGVGLAIVNEPTRNYFLFKQHAAEWNVGD